MTSLESVFFSDYIKMGIWFLSRVTVATIFTIFAHARNFCGIAQSRNCYAQTGRSASRPHGRPATAYPVPVPRTDEYRAGMGPGRGQHVVLPHGT